MLFSLTHAAITNLSTHDAITNSSTHAASTNSSTRAFPLHCIFPHTCSYPKLIHEHLSSSDCSLSLFSLTNASILNLFTNACPFHNVLSHHSLSQMQLIRAHSRTRVLFILLSLTIPSHKCRYAELIHEHMSFSRTHVLFILFSPNIPSHNYSYSEIIHELIPSAVL